MTTSDSSDLGSQFGFDSRKDLGGLLPPRRPAAPAPVSADAPPPPSPAATEPAARTATAPRPSRPTRRPATTRRQSAPEPAPEPAGAIESTSQVSVYIEARVREAIRAERARTHATNAEIAYAAITRHQHKLPSLVAARTTTQLPEGSLFPPRRTGRGAATAGRRVLWPMAATQPELDKLEELRAAAGARSRSELIAVALEAEYRPGGR